MRSQVQTQNRQNDHFGGVRRNFFFFVEKKLIVVFFGLKLTGDYYAVAIIL